MNKSKKTVATIDFMINLAGLVCYKCEECGSVLNQEDVQPHLVAIHQSEYFTITNIPIDQ